MRDPTMSSHDDRTTPDPEGREDLVLSILDRARPILAERRAARRGVLGTMERWRRPVFTASAGLIAAGLAVLFFTDEPSPAVEPMPGAVFPEALLPRPIASWLGEGSEPDVIELIAAIGGYER